MALQTAHTETFGSYTVLIKSAEGYTLEDGVLVAQVYHISKGLLDSHTDGMTLANARDHAKDVIINNLESTPSFYMGFKNVVILGLHNDKVLLADSKEFVIASHTARIEYNTPNYSEIREHSINRAYKGFSPYFNREDIHHTKELV